MPILRPIHYLTFYCWYFIVCCFQRLWFVLVLVFLQYCIGLHACFLCAASVHNKCLIFEKDSFQCLSTLRMAIDPHSLICMQKFEFTPCGQKGATFIFFAVTLPNGN